MTNTLNSIIAILIVIMTICTFMQVVTRYVLHISLPFLIMIISFSMSWLTMIGAAIALESAKHFAINIFSGKEPNRLTKLICMAREAMILVVIISLIYSGWQFTLIGLTKEEPSTGLSEVYSFSSVLGGAFLMLIYFVKLKVRSFKEKNK